VVAAASDPGLKREVNEDSLLADGPAFVVADGMGGYECGDQASAAVIAAFRDRFAPSALGEFSMVHEALLAADDAVVEIASHTSKGAGSTATGVILIHHESHPFWLVFNVGDSRVYRHSGSQLEQLTVDHSLGQELVEAGQLQPADLATFADRNVITRAIGAADSLADSWLVPVVNGERLLICSDGLHGEVDAESIRAILTMNGRPDSAVQVLIDRAKQNGGRDNITAIVIDVMAGGADPLQYETTSAPAADGDDDTISV